MNVTYPLPFKQEMVAPKFTLKAWRIGFLALIAILLIIRPDTREIVIQSMSDAFLAVTVYVAATLALLFWIEHTFNFDLGGLMHRNLRWQPLIASVLGALPGCGGAIIVVTQFTKGRASFGALVSVLVATMGDAAFLLIARDPQAAMIVFSISLFTGVLCGMSIDWLHGRDFMAVKSASIRRLPFPEFSDQKLLSQSGVALAWCLLVIFGFMIGVLWSFQMESDFLFGPLNRFELLGTYGPSRIFGAIGAGMCLTMWAFSKRPNSHMYSNLEDPLDCSDSILTRTIKDTNFVTSWVIMAFMSFELAIGLFDINLADWFSGWTAIMPFVAILIGFIPGCGPQIIVTSLYLSGAIPMSAQMANAIANDGDALFPALVLAPKAALIATIYSAIPAFMIGYGWFFLMESRL